MDTVPTRTLLCTNRAFSLPAFFGIRGGRPTNAALQRIIIFFLLHFPKDLMLLLGSLGWVSAQKLPQPFWHCCSFRVRGLSSLRVLFGEDKGWPTPPRSYLWAVWWGTLLSRSLYTSVFQHVFLCHHQSPTQGFLQIQFLLKFQKLSPKNSKVFSTQKLLGLNCWVQTAPGSLSWVTTTT